MNKKTRIFSIATALVSFVLSASLLSGTVFAGEGLDPCGPNLYTGISYSTESLYIGVDDKNMDFSGNYMYDYDPMTKPSPWGAYDSYIKTIYINEGVYSIGEYAFYDSFAETVFIPDTVTSIGACAFLYNDYLQTVYYGGTEEEWKNLNKNIDPSNDCLLNADVYCMDKGKLVIDLTDDFALVPISRNQEKAISNTLDFFVDCGIYNKQEDPRTGYDFDNDGYMDWLFNYKDGDVFIEKTEYAKIYDLIEAEHKAVFFSNGRSIYDYCMDDEGGAFADPDYRKAYYSDIEFVFRIQDFGELVVDLRDGSFTTDFKKMSMTLSTFETGHMMFYGTQLIDIDTDSSGYKIDIDMDGTYDVSVEDDGNTMTLYPIDSTHKNTKISVAGDETFASFVKMNYMGNYSTLYFKFKDDVVKVDKKPATCDKDGYEEYWKSTDNDNIYADKDANNKISSPKKIPATGHKFGGWTVTTKATVDKTGVETRTCSVCGKKETRDVAKLTPTPTAKPTAKPANNATLTLNKKSLTIVCGKTDSLKATLKDATGKIAWMSSDEKIATVDADGKITAKQAGTVTITATAAGKSASCEVTVLYKDVTNTKDFWYAPTNYLTAKGVFKGYDKQTKFKPANDCTRAQMLTFMWRLQGEPAPKAKTCKFPDVKKTDYFFKPVIWAVEQGITTGYKDGTFKPQNVCTREQTVTFLLRMAKTPKPGTSKNPFSDV